MANYLILLLFGGFPVGASGKVPACQHSGDLGVIPGLGWSPGGGHGNPVQYSCLENPLDRGARQKAHGVAKSWTQLKWLSTHTSYLCPFYSYQGMILQNPRKYDVYLQATQAEEYTISLICWNKWKFKELTEWGTMSAINSSFSCFLSQDLACPFIFLSVWLLILPMCITQDHFALKFISVASS